MNIAAKEKYHFPLESRSGELNIGTKLVLNSIQYGYHPPIQCLE